MIKEIIETLLNILRVCCILISFGIIVQLDERKSLKEIILGK